MLIQNKYEIIKISKHTFLHLLCYSIFYYFVIANDAAKRYLIGLAELELSAQQLNSSNDELIIKMDGDTLTPTGKATSSVVKCPEGQGRYMYLCGRYIRIAF